MSEHVNGHPGHPAGPTHVGLFNPHIEVKSPNVVYTPEEITAKYLYGKNFVVADGDKITVIPQNHEYVFKTKRKIPRCGVMFVGWGGNNGTTVTGGILANKHDLHWNSKLGEMKPNFYGSLTQCTTIRIGDNADGNEVHLPFKNILPMVNPADLIIGGWDISSLDMYSSLRRAAVLDYALQEKLRPYMEHLKPLPAVYYPDFIAANQGDRADNAIKGETKWENLEHIRKDIREFKAKNKLDFLAVMWTANTERFTDVRKGLNMTADEMMEAIKRSDPEVSQSNIYCVAAILEGCVYINGSPQNTLNPGVVQLAERHHALVCGDDFKSGQTKLKSVLVDFLVSAGIKVRSIVSYNHLGNNDGKNLSAPQQFRSKEISKSNVVDDVVASNQLLYAPGERIDHVVVIKYVPFVGDSKRAMDEYSSSIFMNGINTLAIHNVCEDSLLAAPLMIDLVVLSELMTRIYYKVEGMTEFEHFAPVMSTLSYLFKAPMVMPGTPVVNALMKQQRMLTNILCACLGLPPDGDMLLEHKTKLPKPMAPEAIPDLDAAAAGEKASAKRPRNK